jgi:sulfite reductase alpha subunit-like flavoprotein
VAEVADENFRQQKLYGVVYYYICNELAIGETIQSAFVHPKCHHGRPGTGIARFRSFLQEYAVLRKCGKKVGENCLFFGDEYRKDNFYYQREFE